MCMTIDSAFCLHAVFRTQFIFPQGTMPMLSSSLCVYGYSRRLKNEALGTIRCMLL